MAISAFFPWDDDFCWAGFRRQVDEYGELLGAIRLYEPSAFMCVLAAHLGRLYAAGVTMPPYPTSPLPPDEAPDRDSRDDLSGFRRSLGRTLGELDTYLDVFAANEGTPSVTEESLSWDLAEIWRILKAGADVWDVGRHADAEMHWTFTFDEQWGPTLLSALRHVHDSSGERIWLMTEPSDVPSEDSSETAA